MMKMNLLLLFLYLAAGCTVKESPISYGNDGCDYCKMTIMDHRYGSELVTDKGKVYTFDAAECLIEYLYHNDGLEENSRALMVTTFTNPEQLIEAATATFLISRQLPSPMGAYLTAFASFEKAKEFQESKGGELYTWEELTTDFHSIRSEINKDED